MEDTIQTEGNDVAGPSWDISQEKVSNIDNSGRDYEAFVAKVNGNVVAYLTFEDYPYENNAYIVRSFTEENYRQKGIQTRLTDQLIEYMRTKDMEKIVGEIAIDNDISIQRRLNTKDPKTKEILRTTLRGMDEIKDAIKDEKVDPFSAVFVTYINEPVQDNLELDHFVSWVQNNLTHNRYNSTT